MTRLLLEILSYLKALFFRKPYVQVRNDSIVGEWRRRGVKVGAGCYINPDVQLDSMVEIGDDCVITGGARILSHDAAPALYLDELRGTSIFGRIVKRKKTVIGNRCFVSSGAIILCGVTVGDNCVVAAGSVVTKDVQANSVVAGNPARVICSIDEFVERQRNRLRAEPDLFSR